MSDRVYSLEPCEWFSGLDALPVMAAYCGDARALEFYTPHPVLHFDNGARHIKTEHKYRVTGAWDSLAVWRLCQELQKQ